MLKKLLKIGCAGVLVFGVALGVFTIWGYTPVDTFEPLLYEPRAPEEWPTDRWPWSSPEAQGMSSAALVEMLATTG